VLTGYLDTKEANERIRAALGKVEATKETQVAGVGTTKTEYIVRFKDQRSAEAARDNSEWLQELGNETKLVRPRFGVVVHRFLTASIKLPEQKEQPDAFKGEKQSLLTQYPLIVSPMASRGYYLGILAGVDICCNVLWRGTFY